MAILEKQNKTTLILSRLINVYAETSFSGSVVIEDKNALFDAATDYWVLTAKRDSEEGSGAQERLLRLISLLDTEFAPPRWEAK